MSVPFRETDAGLELFLRVTPKAAANRFGGVIEGTDGRTRLKVQVTTVPEDGKANVAVIKLLSKHCKLAKSLFRVTAGATDRDKTLSISGKPGDLAAAMGAILDS